MTSRKIPRPNGQTATEQILCELKTLASRRGWRAADVDGQYCFEYTNPAAGQAEARRFELVQALFFQRFGNDGRGLLDMHMAMILDYPIYLAILTSAAAAGINCRREESPDHLRGKLKLALGL